MLTLTGPGGIGKTRLALQVAAEMQPAFADGVLFVDLAPVSDSELVASSIAQALGVHEAGGQPLIVVLTRSLRDQQLLLVLDNVEQLLEAAPLLAELLAAAPRLKILLTSRAVVGVYGEHVFLVPPLILPDLNALPACEQLLEVEAVRLFVERARAARPDFQLSDANARAISEICHRLDGLPLALELAAARIKLFAPEALLIRLSSRLELLSGGARTLPVRQQTLRNTIDWSYHLLPAETQTLFRRLSVFVGGCTLEAVEGVGGDKQTSGQTLSDQVPAARSPGLPVSQSMLEGLAALVDQSLLRQVESPDGEPRFVMLETIREYALERLEASEEAATLRRAHAAYYLALAEAGEPELHNADQLVWLERLELEHDNLRAVLSWSETTAGELEVGLRLAGALGEFWWRRGYFGEGRAWLTRLLALVGPAQASARAKAFRAAGVLAFAQWRSPQQAIVLLEASLSLCRKIGDGLGSAWALYWLGHAALDWDDLARATVLATESLALFRSCGERGGSGWALIILERVAAKQGEIGRRPALGAEALALFQETGDTSGIARALLSLGELARDQGDIGRAFVLLEESLAHHRLLRWPIGMAFTLLSLGCVVWEQGDAAWATALLKEGLTLFRDLGGERGYVQCLVALAGLSSAASQFARAARLCGAAAALAAARGGVPTEFRATYEQTITRTQAQLDAASFAAAWAEGQAMTREQAIAYALAGEPPQADQA